VHIIVLPFRFNKIEVNLSFTSLMEEHYQARFVIMASNASGFQLFIPRRFVLMLLCYPHLVKTLGTSFLHANEV
jgi:hypothetical protein